MTFHYKGQGRDDELDRDMGADSIYALLKANDLSYAKALRHFTAYRDAKARHTVVDGEVTYFSMLELFNNLLADRDTDLNDERIAAELYTRNGPAIQSITGFGGSAPFMNALNVAIEAAAASFRQNLAALAESFQLTYRHTDIVGLLGKTKVVTKPALVKSRVFETAYILDRILDKNRFLATSLLLGIMHVERFKAYKDATSTRTLYNQGSALFTLLTFSYTPALSIEKQAKFAQSVASTFSAAIRSNKRSKDELTAELQKLNISDEWAAEWAEEVVAKGDSGPRDELAKHEKRVADCAKVLKALQANEVQYGWKIFGSCLGIDNALLPVTYPEAASLWREFITPSYPRVVSESSGLPAGRREMLAVFDEALRPESMWGKADFASFGLTLKASALTEMAYVGPILRIVGWYTSSNHAGLTCTTCRTVHGSRISLVRLWHRCPTCKKVYCPHCASGMKLYAAIAAGALLGGWWQSAGSLLYQATVGWVVGASTGHTASRFLARDCCGVQSEPLC